MDSFSSRLALLICSNSSTLDRAIPDLHADDIDVQIRTGGGANIRDDTRHPTSSAITTQVGPEFATISRPAGAKSGDHTHSTTGSGAKGGADGPARRVRADEPDDTRDLAGAAR